MITAQTERIIILFNDNVSPYRSQDKASGNEVIVMDIYKKQKEKIIYHADIFFSQRVSLLWTLMMQKIRRTQTDIIQILCVTSQIMII